MSASNTIPSKKTTQPNGQSQIGATVAKRAGIVGMATMASRILGLIREAVIAAYFPKELIDAYQIAFMIPNSFRRLTAEGTFSVAVTSVFSKTYAQGDLDASKAFVKSALGFSIIFLAALTTLGVVFAPELTKLAGWGFSENPQKFAVAASLTRTLFPYIFFVSLTALAMGILNSAGRFFAPALAPVLLNIAIIGCAVGISGLMPQLGLNPIFALAFGVILGGIAGVILQFPSLKNLSLLVLPSFNFRNPGLIRVLKMTGPMVLSAATYQIGIFISGSFASTLGDGAVMYIQFANRLVELPLAVLVMAVSTAALPSLAALKGQGRLDEMKNTFNHALRLALFVATPAMIAIIILAEPFVSILYQRGLFSYESTVQTAAALRWLAVSICSIALLRQTVPVFYAIESVRVPMAMAAVYVVVYIISALLLMKPFSHVGLCMAISLGATAQALGLVVFLRRKIGPLNMAQVLFSWIKTLLVSLPMGLAVFGISLLGNWRQGGNSFQNIGVLFLAVIVGAIVYAAGAYVSKSAEMQELVSAITRRRARRKG